MGFIVAQILGVLATVANVASMQLEKRSQILISFILAGIFFCGNYLLLGGYTGLVVCFIATLQTITSYMFEIKF